MKIRFAAAIFTFGALGLAAPSSAQGQNSAVEQCIAQVKYYASQLGPEGSAAYNEFYDTYIWNCANPSTNLPGKGGGYTGPCGAGGCQSPDYPSRLNGN